MTFDRETAASDALLTDLYLDALLAGAVLDSRDGGGGADGALDPAARTAADRLRRDLTRVHPSFRFEERLAAKLAEAAVLMRLPAAAGGEGQVVPFRIGRGRAGGDADGHAADADAADAADAAPLADGAFGPVDGRRPARPLLIGGALTSAALSIAGAAWVAWRLGRPNRSSAMVRAARIARASGASAGRPRRRAGRRSPARAVRKLD
jgi:hypothetical protein